MLRGGMAPDVVAAYLDKASEVVRYWGVADGAMTFDPLPRVTMILDDVRDMLTERRCFYG